MNTQTVANPFKLDGIGNKVDQPTQPMKPPGFRWPSIYFSAVTLEGTRPLHSHPAADEFCFFQTGEASIVIQQPSEVGPELTFDVTAGDAVIFPQGFPHSITNKGAKDSDLRFLVVFDNPVISVSPLA